MGRSITALTQPCQRAAQAPAAFHHHAGGWNIPHHHPQRRRGAQIPLPSRAGATALGPRASDPGEPCALQQLWERRAPHRSAPAPSPAPGRCQERAGGHKGEPEPGAPV